MNHIYEQSLTSIMESLQERGLSASDARHLLDRIRNTKINVLLVGGTGVGKSSTINALLDAQHATVGSGTQPETSQIAKYELNNVIIWDSPGLGDSPEKDAQYKQLLAAKLNEKAPDGSGLLIDLVFLILDGGSRDYSSAYTLIQDVIAPNLGAESSKRLLVGINQADMALKGRYWNAEINQPEEILLAELENKVKTTAERIYQGSGLEVEPIYYCAGFIENNVQQKPYNLAKLLDVIMTKLPQKKRIALLSDVNPDQNTWQDNEESVEVYEERIEQKLQDSLWQNIKDGFVGLTKQGVKVLMDLAYEQLTKENIKKLISIFSQK